MVINLYWIHLCHLHVTQNGLCQICKLEQQQQQNQIEMAFQMKTQKSYFYEH